MDALAFKKAAAHLAVATALVASAMLTGCSDSDPGQLEVAVSTGYPILGATITIKGSNGETLQAVDTAEKGSIVFSRQALYSRLGNGPYLVQSTGGKANGVPVAESYFSIADPASGRANVTPITHLISIEATGTNTTAGLQALFANGFTAAKAQTLTSEKMSKAKDNVATALQLVNPKITINYDPITKPFVYGDEIDKQLDYLKDTLKASGNTIDQVQTIVRKRADTALTGPDDPFQPIRRVIVFGDSLSDGGTYTAWASYAASGQPRFTDPSKPFESLTAASAWGGKFTTNPGPVWVEKLAATFGHDIKPAMLMGGGQPSAYLSAVCNTCTNYAQGGSRVKDQPGIGNKGTVAGANNFDRANAFAAASSLPVKEQIDIHLALPAGKFSASDLVLVLAGANDVFVQAEMVGMKAITGEQAAANIQATATELITQAIRLRQANAVKLLVIGLPDMGNTPAGAAQGVEAAGALTLFSTQIFNAVLAGGLAQAGIAYLDPAEFFNSLMTSPAKYGITTTIDKTNALTALSSTACGVNQIAVQAAGDSTTSPSSLYCSVPNIAVSNAGTLRASNANATYVFADGVHPSSQAHSALADYLAARLPWLLSETLANK